MYPDLHPVDSGPELIDDVAEEPDENEKRNNKNKKSNTKVVNLPPEMCPPSKISDTLWLSQRELLG